MFELSGKKIIKFYANKKLLIWIYDSGLRLSFNRKSASKYKFGQIIIRQHMAFWLLPEISTRDPVIIPRALARGQIMVQGCLC